MFLPFSHLCTSWCTFSSQARGLPPHIGCVFYGGRKEVWAAKASNLKKLDECLRRPTSGARTSFGPPRAALVVVITDDVDAAGYRQNGPALRLPGCDPRGWRRSFVCAFKGANSGFARSDKLRRHSSHTHQSQVGHSSTRSFAASTSREQTSHAPIALSGSGVGSATRNFVSG